MTGWAIPGVAFGSSTPTAATSAADGEQIGEIVVRGNTVMDGYYRDRGRDRRRRFATAGCTPATWRRWTRPGYVVIKDRSKDIIIRGGENISSVESRTRSRAHPAVLECAVVAAPDEQLGEVPVAFVVLKPGGRRRSPSCGRTAATRLARFKVPRKFVFRESLPKGGTGKILKAELREPLWKGFESRVH